LLYVFATDPVSLPWTHSSPIGDQERQQEGRQAASPKSNGPDARLRYPEALRKTVTIFLKRRVTQFRCLMEGQVCQGGRQAGYLINARTPYQYWNYVDFTFQRRCYFVRDVVSVFFCSAALKAIEPLRPDYHQHRAAIADPSVNRLGEVLAGRNVLHVHKNVIVAEQQC
jgi:hypothetical protein